MRSVSLFVSLGLITVAHAQPGVPATKVNQIAQDRQTVEVNLDLHIQPAILVRFPVPAGTDPNEAASELANRYNEILTDNQPLNRFIQPKDVVIYAPVPATPAHQAYPLMDPRPGAALPPKPNFYAIYVLGRKLLSINSATAAASGGASPRSLAIRWAKQLQQSLPMLCWRPPAQSDPSVVADPPLIITTDLAQVGGGDGDVLFHGRKVFSLHGVQPDGKTAIDRAESLSHRLAVLAVRYGNALPPDQQVQAHRDATGSCVTLSLGHSTLVTLTGEDARANGTASPQRLADRWAAALNRAWHTKT